MAHSNPKYLKHCVHCCSVYVFVIVCQCWHEVLTKFGEWYIFITVKALFCCGNCIAKANKKMDSSLYINSVMCNEQQSVLLSIFVVCYDY